MLDIVKSFIFFPFFSIIKEFYSFINFFYCFVQSSTMYYFLNYEDTSRRGIGCETIMVKQYSGVR